MTALEDDLRKRAKAIAAEANECCNRSDGYEEEIEDLALQHLTAVAAPQSLMGVERALPPLRAREEIARIIDLEAWRAIENGRDAIPGSLWGVRRQIALGKADAILSSTAGQEWRDISSAPAWDNHKQVYVWGGRYSAPTLVEADGDYWRANRSRLTMLPTHWFPSYPPAPPVAEPKETP